MTVALAPQELLAVDEQSAVLDTYQLWDDCEQLGADARAAGISHERPGVSMVPEYSATIVLRSLVDHARDVNSVAHPEVQAQRRARMVRYLQVLASEAGIDPNELEGVHHG